MQDLLNSWQRKEKERWGEREGVGERENKKKRVKYGRDGASGEGRKKGRGWKKREKIGRCIKKESGTVTIVYCQSY